MSLIFMTHEVGLIAVCSLILIVIYCRVIMFIMYISTFSLCIITAALFCCSQEDYRRTVTEIDEKEYISLKIIVSELRNQYVCHDRGCSHRCCNFLICITQCSVFLSLSKGNVT